MNTHLFDPCSIMFQHQNLRAQKITCGKCSGIEKVHVNSAAFGGGDDEGKFKQLVTRKFTAMGWRVGDVQRKHRCPACIKEEIANKPFAKLEAIKQPEVTVPTPAPAKSNGHHPGTSLVAEPPPEMTRDDRRVIFAKLNEVYDNERTGYSADWTDKRVAADLGVPLVWVTKMREENCGPEGSNVHLREDIDRARVAIIEANRFLGELAAAQADVTKIAKVMADLVRRVDPMHALIDKTERSIASIEKAVRP